ncbi:TetR/AcrR family transcriptional regulator [Brachybacterium sp. YJGR34]|uniref:TetR/AcrR family transcriptional regulator n=1 Tax=Brachybacterium sp. YJGR34 TaxID=2059911 RepID=UPI0018E5EDC8|nr:TetR/AcrR family transcriptional regulator [Brachybacterium sp. YJGR34]
MAENNETGLPRAVMIAWGMDEAPQRGPSRGLSHERIIAAAIEIADAEGIGAVTMQAVAASLGFTTMSLYRYVANKDELLRLMQDSALQIPAKVKLPLPWRERLRAWANLVRDAYRAHPWVLAVPRGQTSLLMPNSVRAADLGMSALEELDLSLDTKVGVILVISQLASSMVELELSLAAEGAMTTTGTGAELLAGVITPARFPHIAWLYAADAAQAAAAEGAEAPVIEGGDVTVDGEFDLGIDLIIAGIEARLPDADGPGAEG